MDGAAEVYVTLGALLLVSLAADALGRRTRLPRASLLLVVGVLAGPIALDVLPAERGEWFPVAARVALVMVGFLIGGELRADELRRHGRSMVVVTVVQGLGTATVVVAGLLVIGVPTTVALLLGGVATATDPAAPKAVADEEPARDERTTRLLLGVVALDDVVGITSFGLLLGLAGLLEGTGSILTEMAEAGRELGGGLVVGVALGVPAAHLSGRIRAGEPTLEEALAIVLLCSGITAWLDVSFLLAAVTTGAVVVNLASHHDRPFREIESVEWVFLAVFFVLAGGAIDVGSVRTVGAALTGYVVLRTVGKVAGGALGARAAGLRGGRSRWVGLGLLPQAGVALGMAVAAAERFPELEAEIVPVAVASTVLFELAGPLGVRWVLQPADDVPDGGDGRP